MTNTKQKGEKEARVQIRTRQTGPVAPPSGFANLRRPADLDSVDTVAEILRLPIEAPRPENTPGSQSAPGNLTAPSEQSTLGSQPAPGTSTAKGNQPTPSNDAAPGRTVAPGNQSAPRSSPAPRKRTAPGSRIATAGDISPQRDFTKTPNSILRDVLSRGLFRGKSRDIYDYLYARTRGAITPRRSALLTSTEIMRGANIGSDHTLRDNLRHLMLVGLIDRKVNSGAQEGNEYFVFLPEEVNLPFDREGHPLQLSNPPQVGSPGHLGQKLPGAPEAETAGGAGGSSPEASTTSGEPKTSFKTKEEKLDDEAFAGLVALLKQAAEEVTGKGTTSAERDRWLEVAELLVTELRIAAARTTVSSAPAFLAEHLRRRLRKADARQIEREVSEAAAGAASASSTTAKPELTHDQIEEQAGLLAGLMQGGATIGELEEQFAGNFRPAQWHQIRSIALAQHGFSGTNATDATRPTDDVLDD